MGFLTKATDLTAMMGEKEQSLQEKMEVILQKEQEILQLKKGEAPCPRLSLLAWSCWGPQPGGAQSVCSLLLCLA